MFPNLLFNCSELKCGKITTELQSFQQLGLTEVGSHYTQIGPQLFESCLFGLLLVRTSPYTHTCPQKLHQVRNKLKCDSAKLNDRGIMALSHCHCVGRTNQILGPSVIHLGQYECRNRAQVHTKMTVQRQR